MEDQIVSSGEETWLHGGLLKDTKDSLVNTVTQ
jgi:hypothetical protein